MVLLLWFVLVVVEVFRNYYIIEVRKHNPNHTTMFRLRVMVGIVFWIVSPVIFKMRFDQWWTLPIVLPITFFFVFDTGLNISRGLPYFYLGDNSKIDRLQKKYGGSFAWFWWKLILAAGSVALYFYGWRIYS